MTGPAKGVGEMELFSYQFKLLEAKIKIKTKHVRLPTHWEIFQYLPL